MAITLDGTTGITTPGLTNTGTTTIVDLTTTGNTTLGDATTDTLTVGVTGIVKDASGNVGIGTASPANRLNAYDASAKAAILANGYSLVGANANTNNGCIQAGANGSAALLLDLDAVTGGTATASIYNTYAGPLRFGTSNSERMRIDSSGNVGIGNTTPSSFDATGKPLVVGSGSGNQGMTLYAGTSSSASINFAKSTSGSDRYIGQIEYAMGDNSMRLYTNATERMRIDTSGNVMVGTTSSFTGSTASVQVMGPTSNRAYLGLKRETASTSGVCGSIQTYNGANVVTSIDFQSNGANNSGLIQTYTWSAGSVVTGPYVNTGGVSWTTASDETLKDIIAPIEEATSKLSGLRTVFGKYKTDHDDVRRIFLIAQDVQAVLPEAVSTDGNGKLGLNYQDLVPVLVKAIQEQQALIQSLTTRITALETK